MVNYREIIRLKSLDHSNVSVSNSCGSSRNTVAEVWSLAQGKDLAWPIPETLTNKDLQELLYPERSTGLGRKIPDIHTKSKSQEHHNNSAKRSGQEIHKDIFFSEL